MELIVGIVIGIIIGIGLTSAPPWKWQKRKCNTDLKPVDERMEKVSSKKTRATYNKIADEVTHTDKPKKKRKPRKNTGKRKYYRNKKKKVTKTD